MKIKLVKKYIKNLKKEYRIYSYKAFILIYKKMQALLLRRFLPKQEALRLLDYL